MHIVIVDSSRVVLKIVSGLLEPRGHVVHSFTDSAEALAFLTARPEIRVLITSLQVRPLSGLELCWSARLLAEERAKTDRAEKQRFALLIGLGVCRVMPVLGEPLGPERLARRRDPGDEASSSPYAAPQHDASPGDDENTVSGSASLVDRETGWPGRASRVRQQCLALGFAKPRESQAHLRHRHPHIANQECEFAMSGPDLTCDVRHRPLHRLIGDDAGGPARGPVRGAPVFLHHPARS